MISLSMIVKNEEANLKECLESVKDIVGEIVIVDTGSTDGTLEIANQYSAKVYQFDWISDFSAARNYSLSKCSGDYILYLDADERLKDSSRQLLKELTAQKEHKAYNCKILNTDEVNNRPSIMTYVRLFPNINGIEFVGKVHEQIEKSLLQNNVKIAECDVEIIHTGYSISEDELKIKANRNLDILLDEFSENNSSYYAFHIGQTYNILENKTKAKDYFETAVQDERLKSEYKSTALRLLAIYESEKSDFEKAITHINNAIYCDQDQPLNYMVAAQLYNKTGNIEKGLLFIVKALIINRNFSNSSYKSSQNIFLDEYLIICSGLQASLEANDSERFKYFRSELKSLGEIRTELHEEIDFLQKMIDGEYSAVGQYSLSKYSNQMNLELIVKLILRSNSTETDKLFKMLYNLYQDNLFVLREYALFSLKRGDLTVSEELLKNAVEKNISDPAIYFYLISLYLQKNELDKLPEILNIIFERFGENKTVVSQLEVLKQKLAQVI